MGLAAPTQDWQGVQLEHVFGHCGGVEISVRTVEGSSRCPVCGRPSARVHSRYERTVADLPWHGAPVRLRVRTRRFFCDEASCERRIFCERLPEVAAHARKTGRLEAALLAIALELGGRAGARLAAELGLPVADLVKILTAYRRNNDGRKISFHRFESGISIGRRTLDRTVRAFLETTDPPF